MSVTETDEQLEPQTDDEPDADQPEPQEDIDGPDDPEAPDTPPEPAPDEPESQAKMEETGKKLDLLAKHVTKRLGEILGDDATDIKPCPCCTAFGMPGWVFPIDPPDDVRAELYHYLGSFAPTDYKRDNFSRVCEACDGLGSTLSGSKVPQQDTLTCVPCKGRGWVPVGPERGGQATAAPADQNGDALHSPEGELVTPAITPQDTEEVAALKRAGYVVIAPPAMG